MMRRIALYNTLAYSLLHQPSELPLPRQEGMPWRSVVVCVVVAVVAVEWLILLKE